MKTVLCLVLMLFGLLLAGCSHKQEATPQPQTQPELTAKVQTPTPEPAKPVASPSTDAADNDSGLPSDMQQKDEAETRFGKMIVAAKENDYHHKLYFNGKEISEYEGPIRLYEVFNGDDRDYVVGANDSGGIACPLAPFIVEVYNREKTELFQEFDDCRGDFTPKFIDGKVVLEIPPYFPHPDLVPEKELKRAMKTMDVYTWQKGKLLKKETKPNNR
ncbi:MAG: hypothetical protein JST85_07005 [Acidobacteria bacterium]|nr:hypothetical protein [Acidobacteriota bacterium]